MKKMFMFIAISLVLLGIILSGCGDVSGKAPRYAKIAKNQTNTTAY